FQTDGPEASHLLEKFPQPHQNKTLESGKLSRKSSHSIFSSQYLRNEDDPFQAGYEITDPGTPMMIKANDGWYSQSRSQIGSRLSLHSNKGIKQTSGQNSIGVSKRPSYNNLADHGREYRKRERKMSQSKPVIREEVEDLGNDASKDDKKAVQSQISKNYPNEKEVLKSAAKKLEAYKEKDNEPPQDEEAQQLENLSLLKKISIFFDFELFKDFTYVNLMLGITVANFAELNFSILTPIILEEFGFEKYETATFMSLLGITDIVIRFFIPFIADKIGWSNRTFFLLGVMSMALGRIKQRQRWYRVVAGKIKENDLPYLEQVFQ
ncbi:uncharacterized protein LOC108906750, partial [Anoplophora glabripennis]|uniref:uncharacterized protein LOC108906750 n=1 Tax=Anoplophora glabripennis TaxID=217634 RepID=UPI000C79371E